MFDIQSMQWMLYLDVFGRYVVTSSGFRQLDFLFPRSAWPSAVQLLLARIRRLLSPRISCLPGDLWIVWGETANCDFQVIQMKLPLLFILFYFSETSFQLASGNSKMFFFKSSFLFGGRWFPNLTTTFFRWVGEPTSNQLELYQRVAELAGKPTDKFVLPVPAFNVPQLSVAKRWLRNGWR